MSMISKNVARSQRKTHNVKLVLTVRVELQHPITEVGCRMLVDGKESMTL